MTARHKSFSSGARTKDPVTFDIDNETFTAVPQIPGATLLDFVADADSNDGGRAAQAIIDFLTDCVVAEDKERFSAFLRDPDVAVPVETLAEICEYLVTEYTARPTQPSSPSARGRSSRGRGSTVPVSSTA